MLRIRLSYWSLLFLFLWSCHKEEEKFEPYAPSSQAISSILAEKVPDAITNTTFVLNNLSTDKVLETPSGSRVYLIDTDHLFADAGSGAVVLCSTCPDLKIEITEVFEKRDILARGLNTISASGALFESGGMIQIKAICNGRILTLLPGRTLKIQLPHTDPQNGYFVFNQTVSTPDDHRWTNSGQEVFKAEWPITSGTQTGYEMLVRNLGWAACGRLLTEPTSSFCIALPAGFADQNTLAYMVFKNQSIVAPMQFVLAENQFCFANAPMGYQIQMVAVSKLGGQYWLGRAETEIGTNATVPVDTQQMTEDAVLSFVKGL